MSDHLLVVVHRARYVDRDACQNAAAVCGGEYVTGPFHFTAGPDGDRWEAKVRGAKRGTNAAHMLRAFGYHVTVEDRRCDERPPRAQSTRSNGAVRRH